MRSSADAAPEATDAEELEAIVGGSCPEGLPRPFGVRTLDVSAKAYGQSAGVYLKEGDRARVDATGEWTIWENVTAPFGADGHVGLSMFDGCRKGSLVGRIGLGDEAPRLCIGSGAEIVAPSDGLLYLEMNDSGSPTYHAGTLSVTVQSKAETVPSVPEADTATFAFCDYASGWVELVGESPFLVTVPAALAAETPAEIAPSLRRLGDLYAAFEELSGTVPFEGERLRLAPDFGVRSRGWIVADNPLLFDPKMLNAVQPSRTAILRLGAVDGEAFEIARAVGVLFSRSRGGRYQPDDDTSQAFGGLFALYAREQLPVGSVPEMPCARRDDHILNGTTGAFLTDANLKLCLLTELTAAFGWDVHMRFFRTLPASDSWDAALPAGPTPLAAWTWIRQRYTALAGASAADLFKSYRAP